MVAQLNGKHNKEKVIWGDETRITSINDRNCEWTRLFRAEQKYEGKNTKSFSMIE